MQLHNPEARRLLAALGLSLALIATVAAPSRAQTPHASFSMLGYLTALEVDDLNDPLSSGRLVVNGVQVVLPRNLLIKMPGQYLTVNDLFRGPHPGQAPALAAAQRPSGLALTDTPRPAVAYEVQVLGNMVGGQYVAGWVNLTQQDLNLGNGFVRAIDHARGEMLVGPDTGPATARVRINDPLGRYGLRNADKMGGERMDERFAVDPGNAPVAASTGFPMCLPRVEPPAVDPDCPPSNRAPAPHAGRFTCGSVEAEPTAPAHPACRPDKTAPLQVGDHIDYVGMLVEDSPGSGSYFIAAHAVHANLGIYTSPGADPAYVFIEEALVGTLGQPFPGVDQEQTSRFKLVGFTTDPSRRVDVFLLDINGPDETERPLTSLRPSPVAQIGRIRTVLPAKADFLPVTRDVRIRIAGHVSTKVAGGLDSGQYTAPVAEYIPPENTRFGRPPGPVAVPFENFCFLKNGGGLLGTLGRDQLPAATRPVIGPLAPFPASGHAQSQLRADGTSACP